MSLIDDALKRARDQAGSAAAPPGDSASHPPRADPWEYAPLPQRRSVRRTPVAIAAVAGTLALAGGALFLALRGRGPASSAETSAARPERRPDAPAGVSPGSTPLAGSPASSPPAGSGPWRSPVEVAPPPRRPVLETPPGEPAAGPAASVAATAAAAAAVPRAPAAAASPRPRGAASPSRTILGSEAERSAPGAPRAYAGFLLAPNGGRVELGGIVFSETNPVALVNGRVLPVGGVVEGLTIMAIEESRIELAGDGLRAYLALK